MSETEKRYLSADEIAKRLKVAPLTVRRWLKAGKLKGLRAGRLWRVRESDLESFLKEGEGKD